MKLKQLLPVGLLAAIGSDLLFGSFELLLGSIDLWLPLLSQIDTLPMVSIPHMRSISLVGTAFLIGRYAAKIIKPNDNDS